MKTCNTCKKEKPTSAFNKRAASKDGLNARCKACLRDYRAGRKQAIAETNAKYREKNPNYREQWRDNNAGYDREHRARTRAGQAAPAWLDADTLSEMRKVYAKAVLWTQGTAESYEVDHIVPLNGDAVCGLHLPTNLHILPREINRRKGKTLLEENE
jgi:hypothetical protein